jgi:NADPH:quinone reductase-like Zn-dependent oxidoreductase
MQAYELRDTQGIGSIVLAERPIPQIAPQQVLIRVRAVALNRSDLTVAKGSYRRNAVLPLVPCSDGVGEVVDIGNMVTRVRRGDRVAPTFMPGWVDGPLTDAVSRRALGRTIDGLLAEYVVADQDSVVHVPPQLSDEEAATLPTAAVTAWNALSSDANLAAGKSLLAIGTGGVSLFAVQFALQNNLRAIATSGSPEKFDRLRQMGVSEVIDYRSQPDWPKHIQEITGGGVDHVIEVGGPLTLERSLRAVRVGGHISLIGALAGRGQIDPVPIVMKAIRMQGIYVGSRKMFEEMNDFITNHRLRPIIDRTFSFQEVHEAFRHLESGKHFGKVCIRVA